MVKLKTPDEIKRIKEASLILAETFVVIKELVSEGVKTIDLDRAARDFIKSRNAEPSFLNYLGYPASLCTSINCEVIHGIPSRRKLKNGDIVGLDLGVNYRGYYSDAAITLPVGQISAENKKLLNVTRECLDIGISMAVCNNRIHDISRSIYENAKNNNFGVVYQFCGHGVGFAVHEDPAVPNYIEPGPNPRIKAGMVLAIEPMINMGTDDVEVLEDGWTVKTLDRKASAHFEHTIAVFKDHTEILTEI